jgi:transcriptional regulator with XRE-family HTH domain
MSLGRGRCAPPSSRSRHEQMALYATSLNDVAEWRKLNGLSRKQLAMMVSVSPGTVARWEAGETRPKGALAHRLLEMMRFDAAENLALAKRVTGQSRSLSALFDMDDVRLLCASQGLRAIWPNFSSRAGCPFIDLLNNDAKRLMDAQCFIKKVRQGDILGISGVADWHLSIETDPPFHHRWTAVFKAFGTRIVAELSYEACSAAEEHGLRDLIRFGSAKPEPIPGIF